MIPYEQEVMVKCKSQDPGKEVRQKCSVGCIACKICEKTAPGAYVVENNLARVVEGTEVDPSPAVAKCPTKCIYPGLEKQAEEKKVS